MQYIGSYVGVEVIIIFSSSSRVVVVLIDIVSVECSLLGGFYKALVKVPTPLRYLTYCKW